MVLIIIGFIMTFWYKYLNAIRRALKKPEIEVRYAWVDMSAFFGVLIMIVTATMAIGNQYMNRKFIAKYEADPCGIYKVNIDIIQHREFENDPLFGIFHSSRIADLPTVNCDSRPPTFTPRNTSPE